MSRVGGGEAGGAECVPGECAALMAGRPSSAICALFQPDKCLVRSRRWLPADAEGRAGVFLAHRAAGNVCAGGDTG